MGNTLFTNVRIFDGTGEHPYLGEVLVQGNRIKHVGRGSRTVPANGHTVIDGAGATLMPGMTEAHTHFSWNNAGSLDAIFRMPPEEHTLLAATNAKTYLDMGFTSCVGAAAAKPRLDVVIRNAINSGQIPGPRYLANSQEIGTLGGLGDTNAAACRCARVLLRLDRHGAGGDAQGRAHVHQIRRRPDQAQPLGRGHDGLRRRGDADERRGSRHGGQGGQARGKRASAPMRARRNRSRCASATASRSSITPPTPTRRRSTCSRPTRTSIFVGARHRLAGQHLAQCRALGHQARLADSASNMPASSRSRWSA